MYKRRDVCSTVSVKKWITQYHSFLLADVICHDRRTGLLYWWICSWPSCMQLEELSNLLHFPYVTCHGVYVPI